MNKPLIYGVYLDGRLVYKGTRIEICDKYEIGHKSFYEYTRGVRRVKRKYDVRKIGREKVEIKVEKPKSEKETRIEFLLEHLRIYGNVMSVFDPVPYFPYLYDNGFDCRCREIIDDNKSKVTKKHRKREVYYITECV